MLNKIIISCSVLVFASVNLVGDEPRYIEVSGEATVQARPDGFEVTAVLSTNDETTVAAFKKFEKTKSKFNSALNPMVFEKVEVVYDKTEIGNASNTGAEQVMIAMGGGEEPVDESSFVVKEKALVRRTGLKEMSDDEVKGLVAKISDTIVRNGGKLGPETNNMFGWNLKQGGVSYFISNPADVTRKSQAAAMEDARKKAGVLAELSGGRIGRVLSIREASFTATDSDTNQMRMVMQMYGMSNDDDLLTVDSFSNIPVRSSLTVRFELLEK